MCIAKHTGVIIECFGIVFLCAQKEILLLNIANYTDTLDLDQDKTAMCGKVAVAL